MTGLTGIWCHCQTAVQVLHHWGWRGILSPAANNQSGSQIINLSFLKELCSWDSLQMGHEKALGKLQKEITFQNEKLMHIYQLRVTKEQAPSIWGHCWNQSRRATRMMRMVAFLDSNLPKQRWFPSHCLTQAPHGIHFCFVLFIFGCCFNNGEVLQGILAGICNLQWQAFNMVSFRLICNVKPF